MHGGGYTIGGFDFYENLCRNLCCFTQSLLIMCEYRLAPEFRFPSAVSDAWGIVHWAINNIQNHNGDPNNLIIVGDSAGGGLACIIGRDAKEKGLQQIRGQILMYPWVDQHQNEFSHQKFGKGFGINNELLQFFTQCYQKSSKDLVNPDFSPIFGENLNKSVPSLIFLASHDPIRDSGLKYANKLKNAGVKVLCKTYQPTIHGFAQVFSVLPRGKEIFTDFIATINEWLKSISVKK